MQIYYDDDMIHSGIIGMKWGVRRYQNPDGTLTEAGKKRYAKLLDNQSKRNKKKMKFDKKITDKTKWSEAAQKERAEIAKKQYESFKESVKRNPTQLYKYRYLFTDEELSSAQKRLQTEQALKTLSDQKIKQGADKLNAYMTYLTAANVTFTAISNAVGNVNTVKTAVKKKKQKQEEDNK